jgi:ADP-dependent NAD(P)H-hydrate dehydratase / NAD(P)H-hydrate epimerase
MREAEQSAFARGVAVEALMDEAGAGIARAVAKFFPKPGTCIVFAGKGHNAGDALFAAECLKRAGWKIEIRLAFPEGDGSELMRKKLQSLCNTSGTSGASELSSSSTILLDGLLGLGANHLLREPIRACAVEINRLRGERNAFVFAVDLPTGLDSDTGEADSDCVVADFTVTIGFAKHGLIEDVALDLVGRLEVVPLPDLAAPEAARNELIATPESLRPLLPRRRYGAYKNQFHRIGIVAGSKGFVGAALMTTSGALRAGAGLVEVFVPEEIYPIVAAAAPVEAMVKPVRFYRALLDYTNVEIWALGPGLGQSNSADLLKLIGRDERPMIVDADGLNLLAENINVLKLFRGHRLLTPHPGEMKRLCDPGRMSRAGTARNFCEQFPVALLYKGSRTIVAERGRPLSYNLTGNPGMASGGMGDVLTGVCAGLVGQNLPLYDAARVGAWLCARAAELAIFNGQASEQSLLATDVLEHLGAAFNDLQLV